MNIFPDTVEIITNFIKSRVADAESEGVVLGLSGGLDSAVTLSLAVSALGPERVTGLIMPFHVTESVDLANNHAKYLGVNTVTININDIVSSYKKSSNLYSEKLSEGNLHSRIILKLSKLLLMQLSHMELEVEVLDQLQATWTFTMNLKTRLLDLKIVKLHYTTKQGLQ